MLKPCLVFPSLNPFENQVYFYKHSGEHYVYVGAYGS